MATSEEASVSRYIPHPKTLAILGCPFGQGQGKEGVDQGPTEVMKNDILKKQLEALGWQVEFDGPLDFTSIVREIQSDPEIDGVKHARTVSAVCEYLKGEVEKCHGKDKLPVVLGGDHSLSMGSIAATLGKYPNAGVIWVDAHADINSSKTSGSGNIHGMPNAFLLGLEENDELKRIFGWVPVGKLTPDRLVYIGLRDVDSGEKLILAKNNIRAFSMHEVDKFGIGEVVRMAVDDLQYSTKRPIHLSFDVDAFDPSVAPATGTPVPGGLTFREGLYLCEAVYATGSLIALDIMEINPFEAKGDEDKRKTIEIGRSVARSALGQSLLA